MKITLICLFIVIQNKVIKYMTNIGQNTGILKASMNVQHRATNVLLVTESQNLNSGSRRINGLNSSVALVGKAGPLSSSPETLYSYDQLHVYLVIDYCIFSLIT